MKKVGSCVGILVSRLVAVVVIFAALQRQKYRGTIQSQLEKRLAAQLCWGTWDLRFSHRRFRVEEPRLLPTTVALIRDAPFHQGARRMSPSSWHPRCISNRDRSLSLQRSSVNLIKNSEGIWNFASLGHPDETNNTPARRPASPPKPHQVRASLLLLRRNKPSLRLRPAIFQLGSLMIQDGPFIARSTTKQDADLIRPYRRLTLTNYSRRTNRFHD